MGSSSTLRIAVLINTPPGSSFWDDVRQSYSDAFGIVAPEGRIDFYDPVSKGNFPDPQAYDLIVLSGGKADASSSEPWVLRVLDFVRTTVQLSPKTKILGICWGHQAIIRALGGDVGAVATGPIACIQDVRLTEAGKRFFSFAAETGFLRLPEFHVREVKKPASGFVQLIENNECFVNKANTVISIQAHPEIQTDLAKKMLLEEDDVYNGRYSQDWLKAEAKRSEQLIDGINVLRRVVEWVKE